MDITLTWLFLPFIFIFGLIVGSFINVVIHREVNDESWIKGRSKCDHCKKIIPWYDNVPLLSFLLLRGKSRCCSKCLSWVHPFGELLMGIGFASWFYLVQEKLFLGGLIEILLALLSLVVISLLIAIFISDLFHYYILDVFVYPLIALSVINLCLLFFTNQINFTQILLRVLSALAISTIFFALWFFTKGKGFGFGDVKLAIPLSLLLAYPHSLEWSFLAFVVGSIVGIGLMLFKKKSMKQRVPFGPFMIVGAMLAHFFGQELWAWYVGLIL